MEVAIMNLNLVRYDAIGNYILNLASAIGKNHDVSLLIQDASSIDASIWDKYRFKSIDGSVTHIKRSLMTNLLDKLRVRSIVPINKMDQKFTGDVIWANYPRFYTYMNIFKARNRNVKGIFDYHGVTPPELWDKPDIKPILQEGVENTKYVKYADIAIAHSDFTKKELEAIYDNQVIKIPYAIDTSRFTPGNGYKVRKKYSIIDNKILLYVGRMAGNKRVDVILRSLSIVKKFIPDIKFICIGNINYPHDDEYKKLRKIVVANGLEENVIFTGSVDDVDLPDYFRAADIYVTSSVHEGFCIPLIEAMACGKPVIGSACTAIPETIGEGGIVFSPCDEQALAQLIVRILDDKDLYRHLSDAGLRRAKQFTFENFERSVNNVLEMCE
ncbi:glycosyltransferase family 4 protein [Methanocella conradii]|uniref:glycosyltransferase family 4 protein n=1 Tax=Methanocella conradii TaxID=1175444 RepID=UPI00157C03FA|nr:glycosyltransferase family 4 protein [Methanocella conradii]